MVENRFSSFHFPDEIMAREGRRTPQENLIYGYVL